MQGTGEIVEQLLAERARFLSFVRRRVSDPTEAEDLLHTVYIRALEHVAGLRDAAAARAWFYRMLRNAVIDLYRHRAVESALVGQMTDGLDAPMPLQQESTICRCIDRAIDQLKPEYAQVLREVELVDGGVGTVAAYAERSGMTPGNTAVRAFRARKALAKSLSHTCGSCAGAGCLDCTCAREEETAQA